jgi:serine/threonine protein kinase
LQSSSTRKYALLLHVCRFIVNIRYAFQDRETLYLASDLLTGGDLRFHIGKKKRFTENETRFMMGCLILGLEYMHSQSVIHRDMKPENIIMEENGYLRITDFGISKIWKEDNSADTSGTPGYMAPEVMCRQPHTYAVDYFALGVIGFEFMLGRRPYVGKTRKDIRDMMFACQV